MGYVETDSARGWVCGCWEFGSVRTPNNNPIRGFDSLLEPPTRSPAVTLHRKIDMVRNRCSIVSRNTFRAILPLSLPDGHRLSTSPTRPTTFLSCKTPPGLPRPVTTNLTFFAELVVTLIPTTVYTHDHVLHTRNTTELDPYLHGLILQAVTHTYDTISHDTQTDHEVLYVFLLTRTKCPLIPMQSRQSST